MPARMTLLLVCCLTVPVLSAEEELPTSPPPMVGIATFGPQVLQLRLLETRTVTERRTRKVPVLAKVDGKTVTQYRDEAYVVARPVAVAVTRVYKAGFFRVYDAAGKLIPESEIEKQRKQTVLLSADGKPVPEFYRKLYRPETLIVVAPRPTLPPGRSAGIPQSAPPRRPVIFDEPGPAPKNTKPQSK